MESKADKAKMAEAEGTEEREDTKREEGNFRKPMVEEEMEIARIIEKKQEEDLIEIRMVEEIVSRRFHKYLKVFEKKLKRIPMRKT